MDILTRKNIPAINRAQHDSRHGMRVDVVGLACVPAPGGFGSAKF